MIHHTKNIQCKENYLTKPDPLNSVENTEIRSSHNL